MVTHAVRQAETNRGGPAAEPGSPLFFENGPSVPSKSAPFRLY